MTSPPRRLLAAFGSYLLLAFLALLLVRYLKANLDELSRTLASVRALPFIGLVLTGFGLVAVNAWAIRLSLQALQLPLPFGECLLLSAAGLFLNLILPLKAGSVFQAIYLKRRHGFLVAHSLAFNLVLQLLNLLLVSAISLAYLLGIRLLQHRQPYAFFPLLAFFASAIAAGLLFLVFANRPLPVRWPGILGRIATSFHEGWHLLTRHRPIMSGLLATVLISFAVATLQVWLSFPAQGASLGPGAALFVASLTSLGPLVNLTPGGLGIQEGLILLAGLLLRHRAFTLVVSGLLIRTATSLAFLLCGLPATLALSRWTRHT